MAIVNITVQASSTVNATKTVFNGNGWFTSAPYTYIDSASSITLPAFPLSTAISVGNTYAYTADSTNGRRYWECVVAGTTGASQPTGAADGTINNLVTSGGAQLRLRAFTGWARARPTWVNGVSPYSPSISNNTSPVLQAWTVLVASTSSFTLGSNIQISLGYPRNGSGGILNFPGPTIISVNKTPAIPVTFAAGAKAVGTNDFKGLTFFTQRVDGIIRGMYIGHDNTATVAANLTDVYELTWGRYYDCTFESFRTNNASGSEELAVFRGGRHNVRCTFKSSAASNPAPALSGGVANRPITTIEVPTVTRLTSATTSVVRGAQDILAIGWDASSFTGGPLYAYDSTTGSGNYIDGGAFRTLGVNMKATPFAYDGSIVPRDLSFSGSGSTPVGEYRGGRQSGRIAGDGYGLYNTVTTNNPEPFMARNGTFTRSGGASDALGAFSYACLASKYLHYPYRYEFWNAKTDESFLITMEYEWSSTGTGLTALRTEDVWMEAVFLDHPTKMSGSLVFSFDKYDRKGLIHNGPTPTAAPTSSATWAGSLTSAVKQSMSVIVTPRQAGPIRVFVGVWQCPWTQNISTLVPITVYVDPLPVLSAAP